MAGEFLKPSCPQVDCLAGAGLADRVFLPGDIDYTTRNESYWSKDPRLQPACIVTPRSAEEVSKAVLALKGGGYKFASKPRTHLVAE